MMYLSYVPHAVTTCSFQVAQTQALPPSASETERGVADFLRNPEHANFVITVAKPVKKKLHCTFHTPGTDVFVRVDVSFASPEKTAINYRSVVAPTPRPTTVSTYNVKQAHTAEEKAVPGVVHIDSALIRDTHTGTYLCTCPSDIAPGVFLALLPFAIDEFKPPACSVM